MTKKIIATVGMAGSGKSVAGERLESLGFAKVYFGGLTIEEVKRRGLEVNEKNERAVREELRHTHGMGAFAILSLPKIEEILRQGKCVLIDGLYSFSEFKILNEKYGSELLVIAVFTPRELRYRRLAHREVRPLTLA
jgi:dephospho-CoA kinase